jgi:PhnB protein
MNQVQAYLFFDGRCEEALELYRRVFGAQVEALKRFKELPPAEQAQHAGNGEKILHASFRIGKTQILASDGYAKGQPKFEGFALAVDVPTPADADRLFNALADGGAVRMPLAETFFSPRFGMVADKFGITWMVITSRET